MSNARPLTPSQPSIWLVALIVLLGLIPGEVHAQWDDRSDEIEESFGLASNTELWLVAGGAAALVGTLVFLKVRSRGEDEEEDEQSAEPEPADEETAAALSEQLQRREALSDGAHAAPEAPVALQMSIHPVTRRPGMRLTLRF